MFWHKVSKKKPKEDDWYLCTIDIPGYGRRIIELYYYAESGRFIDRIRQDVFNMYEVFAIDIFTKQYDKHITTDLLCDRTDCVVAWRKMPKAYTK